MYNWADLISYVGMVALLIWAVYLATTVVNELRKLNEQASGIKAFFSNFEVQEIAHRSVSISESSAESNQQLREIRTLLDDFMRELDNVKFVLEHQVEAMRSLLDLLIKQLSENEVQEIAHRSVSISESSAESNQQLGEIRALLELLTRRHLDH